MKILMKVVCLFFDHHPVWNHGDPKCDRCDKYFEYDDFMNKHSKDAKAKHLRW